MAVEEAKYTVIAEQDDFQVREYEPHILAETVVEGDFEEAGNRAFRRLFGYITGNNRSREKVAMTAPVGQAPASEKIAMTSPVGQTKSDGQWAVSFMMPASYTMDTIPAPADPKVRIREVPAHYAAAIEYSGFWTEEKYQAHKDKLLSWIEEQGLSIAGDPTWARYDPPFKPWFLRRNEILIPIERPRTNS